MHGRSPPFTAATLGDLRSYDIQAFNRKSAIHSAQHEVVTLLAALSLVLSLFRDWVTCSYT